MTTTDTALRLLIETLGELYNTPGRDIGTSSDPLESLHYGITAGVDIAMAAGEPGVAKVYAALADLVAAVRADYIREGVALNG